MPTVRYFILIILTSLLFPVKMAAQTDIAIDEEQSSRQKVFRGKYHKVTEEGDTVLVLEIGRASCRERV